MKTKTLLKKLKLQDQDFETIKKAVAEAEAKTTGEIAVAVAPESAHYSFWELLASIFMGIVILAALLPFSAKIAALYKTVYWQNEPTWILPAVYCAFCFTAILVFFYLVNIPALDRIVIPRAVRASCVNHRVMRYFTESGVYDTAEHTGILIFVSYMEREVRIIADRGISEKISQDMWNLIADELIENLRNGQTVTAFTNAIAKCGDLLAQHFPPHQQNPNELPDGLVILEDAEWY